MVNAIVSTSDDNRIDLFYELLSSIKKYKTLNDYQICLLSTDLSEKYKDDLKSKNVLVVESKWQHKFSKFKIKGREYLRSCLSIPFINTYFPDFENYIWIDADAWINDPIVLDYYLEAAKKNLLGVTPQIDRSYGDLARVEWFLRLPRIKSIYYKGLKKINYSKAKKLSMKPVMNAGVWSLAKKAPHWQRWQELAIACAIKGRIFTADQLSLGLLIYDEGYKAEFLPSYCNWLCDVLPKYNKQTNKFVEPSIPHENIGIMHLASLAVREKNQKIKIKSLDGEILMKSIRFNQD